MIVIEVERIIGELRIRYRGEADTLHTAMAAIEAAIKADDERVARASKVPPPPSIAPPQILPCRWCRRAPTIGEDCVRGFHVICMNEACPVRPGSFHATSFERAVESWNATRPVGEP